MLEVSGLECLRGRRRLFGDLTFSVHPGELLYVQGANGSGKTSILQAIDLLTEADDLLAMFCDRIVKNKSIGIYDGAYKCVELATGKKFIRK